MDEKGARSFETDAMSADTQREIANATMADKPDSTKRPRPTSDSSVSSPDGAQRYKLIRSDLPSPDMQHALLDPVAFAQEIKLLIINDIEKLIELKVTERCDKIMDEKIALACDAQFKAHADRLKDVEGENALLHARVAELETKLDSKMNERVLVDDELEQYIRRDSVRVWGIPESAGENTDSLILQLCNDLSVTMTPADIARSHRVGKPERRKTRAIICKFATYNKRRALFKERSQLRKSEKGKNIYVSEDLTARRSGLLYTCRRLKNAGFIQGCWTTDGRILVKDLKDDILQIMVKTDIAKFQIGPLCKIEDYNYFQSLL